MNYKIKTIKSSHLPKQISPLGADAINLFMGQKAGHMGIWEYGDSYFEGDLAGGAHFWADAIKSPGHYYLVQAELDLLRYILNHDMIKPATEKAKAIVEFGPGSTESIERKTVPLLKACQAITRYVSIDGSMEQANLAKEIVEKHLGLRSTAIVADFTKNSFKRTWEGPATYIMWGGTIGNLPGFANADPKSALTDEIRQLQKTLLKGDMLILIFDTNEDQRKIVQAYSEPSLRRHAMSWLHALKRDGDAFGEFDPNVWSYEPVWFPDVMQCAHTIFPMLDQRVTIGGHTIHIPAWRRFVSNNSYKFRPDVMIDAAKDVGLKARVIQQGPMAMLVAEK